jgi:hypothetical protein
MTAIKGIVVLILAAGAGLAAADTVYKYEGPGGKVIYSDSPVPGAKLIGQFELVPAPMNPDRATPAPQPPSGETSTERRLRVLDEADTRIKASARALTNAEERQQQAVEPLPGERRGNAGGRSRLTPGYFARQRAAAAAVDTARTNLDDAYNLRNDVRE